MKNDSEAALMMAIIERSSDRTETNLARNEELTAYWRGLARDKRFHEVLAHAYSDLGPYSPGNTSNINPHIQSENNGGFKGAYMMISKLLTGYRDAINVSTQAATKETPIKGYDSFL